MSIYARFCACGGPNIGYPEWEPAPRHSAEDVVKSNEQLRACFMRRRARVYPWLLRRRSDGDKTAPAPKEWLVAIWNPRSG